MKIKLLILVFLPFFGKSQGIHFEELSDWKSIKAKAVAEGKYIFIDCYTTWCAPCKYMDDSIFSKAEVGDYMNKHFINIKMQMDSTKRDSDIIKRRYYDAGMIKEIYGVDVFPTYLFFAPDGHIVHREAGASEMPLQFITKTKNAFDPDKQYYTLLDLFNRGNRDSAHLRELVLVARNIGQDSTAMVISNEYIKSLKNVYSMDNLSFISRITRNSKDKGFDLYLHHSFEVNSVMGQDYAQRKVLNTIMDEDKNVIDANKKSIEGLELLGAINGQDVYVKPAGKKINDPPDPDWNAMFSSIYKSYGQYYADRTVKWTKLFYYNQRQIWPKYIKATIEYVKKYRDNVKPSQFNDFAFSIFNHSNNKNELTIAMQWIREVLAVANNDKNLNAYLDTYANLLYKMGKRDEAIEYENKAVQLTDPDLKETYLETLRKIKNGKKTWE